MKLRRDPNAVAHELILRKIQERYIPFNEIGEKIRHYQQRPWHKPQFVIALKEEDYFKIYYGQLSFTSIKDLVENGDIDEDNAAYMATAYPKSRFLRFEIINSVTRILATPIEINDLQDEMSNWYLLEINELSQEKEAT